MIELPLLFALQAGMITTVSPCAFPMLPAYIAYHLGVNDEGFAETPAPLRALRAIFLGLVATLGFAVVSGSAGLVIDDKADVTLCKEKLLEIRPVANIEP